MLLGLRVIGIVAILLNAGYHLAANHYGLMNDPNTWRGAGYGQCDVQFNYRAEKVAYLESEKENAVEILSGLKSCASGKTCDDFADRHEKRKLIDSAEKDIALIENRLEKYPFEYESIFSTSGLVGLSVLVLVSLYLSSLSNAMASKVIPDYPNTRSVLLSLAVLFSISATFFIYRYNVTSIIGVDKTWFTNESFCVRGPTLSYVHIFAILLSFIVSLYPSAVLWGMSSTRGKLPNIQFDHEDGKCGLRDYFTFWVVGISVAMIMVTIVVLSWYLTAADGGALPNIFYELSTAAAFILVFAFLIRILFNLIRIRLAFQIKAREARQSGSLTDKGNIPEDPTTSFLGTFIATPFVVFLAGFSWFLNQFGDISIFNWLLGLVV